MPVPSSCPRVRVPDRCRWNGYNDHPWHDWPCLGSVARAGPPPFEQRREATARLLGRGVGPTSRVAVHVRKEQALGTRAWTSVPSGRRLDCLIQYVTR